VLLELATPTRQLVSEEVDEVVAPGSEGYFGVLPGHAAFLATLGSGEVVYRRGRDEVHLAVHGGFAEVTPERVIILAETAERPDEIDRARAERARQRAEQRMTGRDPDGAGEIDFDDGRDLWWDELVEGVGSDPESCPCEPMDSEDLLYLLYTSGSTALPKGVKHSHASAAGIVPCSSFIPPGGSFGVEPSRSGPTRPSGSGSGPSATSRATRSCAPPSAPGSSSATTAGRACAPATGSGWRGSR